MKILVYNILRGGEDKDNSRIPFIEQVVKDISPDLLAMQEAVHFNDDHLTKLQGFASNLGFKNVEYTQGKGRGFDVATFSNVHIKKISDFKGIMRNGALNILINSKLGEISLCNVHLTPGTEDQRTIEIKEIIASQKQYEHKIIVGDLNSLARTDKYSSELISKFNEGQKKKFLTDGKPQYDVINTLLKSGYVDVASAFDNMIPTVPTASNEDEDHEAPLRLDYVFVSESLIKHISEFSLVNNDISDKASDHYPLVFTLD